MISDDLSEVSHYGLLMTSLMTSLMAFLIMSDGH